MSQSWNKQTCEVRNDVGSSGQFYHGIEYEVSNLRPGEVPEKPDATMYVKGQELTVTRYAWDGLIVCSSLAFGSPNIHHALSPQRLAERLQEGHKERRERALLVHPPQRNRPHRWRRNRLHCFQSFLKPALFV